MIKPIARRVALALLPCLFLPVAAADRPENRSRLSEALKEGTYGIALLYRVEDVSSDVFAKDATGSKLRTTLSYRSAAYRDFAVELELEDVTDIGARKRHDNGGTGSLFNGVTDRPRIADPEITEVQRLNLSYHGFDDTAVTIGRQEIGLGNLRFVGPVAWRLNHQSYDAVRIDQASLPRTRLTYAYLDRANTPTNARRRMSSHALHVEIDAGRFGEVQPYWYDLDFEAAANAGLSTRTFGAAWTGTAKVGEYGLPFRVELAQQDDAADNPGAIDAGYMHLVLGATRGEWAVSAGFEVLEGDPANGAFSTPLATLHAFNGWADQFLSTPANGLEDLYLSIRWKRDALSVGVIVHDFGAESAGPDHGSEVDAVVSYRAPWEQTFAIHAALFDADDAGAFADTEKLWFSTSYRF